MNEGDVAFRAMWSLVDGFASCGVRLASISPGSRSTPIALALARHPGIDLHVHLDERASGFFALGAAKATGTPTVVACTSGTATANLFPAIVEASMSRVPLIVLTGDRPPELRGVGANQTIDQLELYGRYVRSFEDAPVPSHGDGEAEWRERGVRAVATALARRPSPVHLNLPFREPLVPGELPAPGSRIERQLPSSGPPPPPPPADAVDLVADHLRDVRRGVIYVGGLREEASSIAALARSLRWPLIAEPHSGARSGDASSAAQFLLSNEAFAAAHRPQVVLQFGAAPTSRASLSFVANAEHLVIIDPDDLVADPARHAELSVAADAGTMAAVLLERESRREPTDWIRSWGDADERARRAVDELVDAWGEPFEGRVARDVADAIPEGSQLLAGSSMPIRDLDAYMRPRRGIRVLANRGASGIDGFVSTILGASASGAPTFALLGDLTLLHDIGSLVWCARRGYDAVLVVLNNGGGTIFSFLPQHDLPELERLFTTPHAVDIGAIARSCGAGHTRVERAKEIPSAILDATRAGGVHVVEVAVDAELNLRRHAEVHAAVSAALA
ncbi:MAG TPA: 2-succinyl-5-enolpyruvyl-6-hydroxy-3-cyclohexene-1-carboxylic-acid synthase [Actinomycetota bacterium]|nr:2-succinyl-5-enolpyruvyl-6-hydroxy-3-cyclohexene-1-carboxylic-acid synthase [Actinomycetota bacterium]